MPAQESIVSLIPPETERIFIAYSGGMDSHVLLHLASTITKLKSKITAVYIHHDLQEEASQWALHCEEITFALGVNFDCINVNAQKILGKSPEEIARDVRYAAFKTLLGKHDVLLLAQHREDQMETVLLQLFRGAGVQGLSGMPLSTDFGVGVMIRPFLDVSKQEITNYAEVNHLKWVEDPSNQWNDFDRNFLRNQILPQLKQRWPALDKTIARSARHCASSNQQSQELAKQLLNKVIDESDRTLVITQLLKLDVDKQQLIIRQWFNKLELKMPSEKKLDKILNEVVLANINANPEIQGQGYCIRRYRDKLYCLNLREDDQSIVDLVWSTGITSLSLNNEMSLTKIDSSEGISKAMWDKSEIYIKYRKGSERIKLTGRTGHHTLKNLFQEKAIPPWERSHIPLIYLNGKLAAIADIWISADFYSQDESDCYQFNWSKK